MTTDLETQEALRPFAGMVELTLCGQQGSQMVHGSEIAGIVDFNTPSVNVAAVLASDSIDLSSLGGPDNNRPQGPQVHGPRKPGGPSYS